MKITIQILRMMTAFVVAVIAPAVSAQVAVPSLAAQAAEDYRAMARFPEWSQPLEAGAADPIAAQRQATVQTQAGPGGDGPALSVWASDMRFEAGDTVTVYARLHSVGVKDADLPIVSSRTSDGPWTVTGLLVSYAGETLAELSYRDDGKGGDELAGDGVYSASYTLSDAQQPAVGLAENIAVKVSAQNEAGEIRKAIGGFLFSHPAAVLTGRYRDSVEEGNLAIAAEVLVEAPGRFHLAGTLGRAGGLPLATAQTAQELAPGKHWITLSFYGLILREQGLPGIYQLQSVTLTTANGMPNALGPVEGNVFATKMYLPTVFNDKPFNRADLLEAAARLEAGSR